MLALISQATITNAQEHKKSEIAFSAGPAFAIGKFADTDLMTSSSGFAKTGQAISVSYVHPLSEKWKFLVSLSGQRNPLNTKAFETIFSTATVNPGFSFGSGPNNPPPQTTYVVYPNWKFENKSWMLGSLQVGVLKEFVTADQHKWTPTLKAAFGAVYASLPGFKGSSVTDTATAAIAQSKLSGFGLTYTVGAGINYALTKKIALFTIVDYNNTSDIKFDDVKSTLTTTKGTVGSPGYAVQYTELTTAGKQAISSINLMFGISLVL